MATTGTSTGRPIEIRALTGLRIVAAVWVMVGHLTWPLAGPYGEYLAPLWPVLTAGWLGVDLFFVLSGFVITWTYLDKLGRRFSLSRTADFVWARFARVWPVWALLTVPFAFWLLVTRADEGTGMYRPVDLPGLIEQLLMVQMWHRDYPTSSSYIVPGWSISAEWLAYLCFPLVVLVLWRLRGLPASLLALGGVGAMVPSALIVYVHGYQPLWSVRIAGGFVAGAMIAMAVRRTRRTATVERLARIVAVLCVIEVVLICWWATWRADGNASLDFTGVAMIVFPVLVGALALTDHGLAGLLSRETLVVGGRISFCLYLVHTIVFEVFDLIARRTSLVDPEDASYVLVLPQLFLVALALSWVLHTRVEEPARIWLRDRGPSRWTGRRSRATAAAVPAAAPSPAPAPSPVPVPLDEPVRPRSRAALTASMSAAPVVRPRTASPLGHRPAPAPAAESPFEPSVRA